MSYVGIILNLYNFLEKGKILNPQRQLIILQCCSVRFISRTDPTSNQLGRAVQYTYSLYQAKRDGTPNEPDLSKEIHLIFFLTKFIFYI